MADSNFVLSGRFLEILGQLIVEAEIEGIAGPDKQVEVVNRFVARCADLKLPIPTIFQDKARLGEIVNIVVALFNILEDGGVNLSDLKDFSVVAGNLVALLKGD